MTTYRVDGQSVAWRIVDDEAVLIHQTTSEYFSLNSPGTFLWGLLAERACDENELAGEIARRYQLGEDLAQTDTAAFLDKLASAALVLCGEEAESAAPSPVAVSDALRAGLYEPPDLVRFGDLETLILSGE